MTIVITGYRGSLQSSTNAKKRSVGFSDSFLREDIGKFPDTNIVGVVQSHSRNNDCA